MRSNKGISLVSLTIYLIVLTVLVGITAQFTRYFYRNSSETETSSEISQQYTRVIEYLIDDVNSGVVDYITISDDKKSLYFYFNDETTHQYFWDENNKKIYYLNYTRTGQKNQQIILCGDVSLCEFTKDLTKEYIFTLNMKVGKTTYNNIFMVE